MALQQSLAMSFSTVVRNCKLPLMIVYLMSSVNDSRAS